MFDADRAITKCSQDRLNRAQFAKYLARCVLEHQDPDSLVVGLYGSWGTGKTSIINMAIEELTLAASAMRDDEKPIVLNFSPWSYSGQNQLIYSFFRRLSSTLRSANHLKNADRIIYLLELYVSFFTNKPIPKPLRQKRSFWQRLKKQEPEELYAWESGRDLTLVKAELNNLLREQKQKIIIIIDNISRIQNDEVKQIFQIVKSMGDYANTSYLLSFDKNQVTTALNRLEGSGGEEYVEKIVQLPFEVPPISKQDLENIFSDRLTEIVDTIPGDTWNIEYWADVYYSSLKYFFMNCRDITRYVNTLNFGYSRLRDVVNPVDYFTLTAIEVFLPNVYSGIRDNKDLFTDLFDNVYTLNNDQINKDKLRCDEILARNNRVSKDILVALIIRLFPRIQSLYQPAMTTFHSLDMARKQKRACSPEFFDIYFRLSMQSGQIAPAEFETILSFAADKQQFDFALARLNQDNRIEKFLDRLDGNPIQTLPTENIASIVNALIDNGDLFPLGHAGALSLDTPMRIHRIIHGLLKRIKDSDERYEVLKNAIQHASKSLFTMVHEVHEQSREHMEDQATFLPISYRDLMPEQLALLKKMVVKQIAYWADHERLAEHPRLLLILYSWMDWGDEEACHRFVSKMTKSDRGLVSFLTAALDKAITQATTKYEKHDSWYQYLNDIDAFIDPKDLEAHAKALFEDGYFEKLREREQLAIMIFLDLIKSTSVKTIPHTTT